MDPSGWKQDGRKLCNETINYMNSAINISGDQITKNGMEGTCGTYGILQTGYGV
jgi:hypothetical protein